ncbi:venom carboxylesterase-6 [Halyomorpha halys]|uniref:venom carboxylesterase-6 n=1 Tax=Halyomorpha halys TaxID=286706 RepID=UPI0006D52847|nr:venom carboxylesterase-6 [Halyomorpha halys]
MLISNWLCVFISFLISVCHCSNQPEVRTVQGTVKGLYTKTINNRQIASFEGIPYAKPPAGKHRFKAPVAYGLWYGVLNATREPPPCLQIDVLSSTNAVKGSEDCLYVNVYTPQLPVDSAEPKLLDVIAFIHGGAYMEGNSKLHDPSILLDKDIVLVTINYRVGILGFLSTEDDIVPGNNGLKDQSLALKWIQQNIAFFGGNPKSVTLGGHSSGGSSCHLHLLSPLSKGLFKSAIVMSSGPVLKVKQESNEKAKIVANDLGCPTNDSLSMVNCLRNRPASHIVSLSPLLQRDGSPALAVGPVIEPPSPNAFISEPPINIIKNKGAADIPILFSFVADEGLIGTAGLIIDDRMFEQFLKGWEDTLPYYLDFNQSVPVESRPQIVQKIKDYYKIENSAEGKRNLVKLVNDRVFLSSISKVAKLTASLYSSPVYMYKFSYRGQFSLADIHTKENLGVCHGDDLYYILGYLGGAKNVIKTEEDLQVSKLMLDVWASFAANGSLGENWPPIQQELPKIVYTEIKGPEDLQLSLVDELGEENFWDSLGFNENGESPIISHTEL